MTITPADAARLLALAAAFDRRTIGEADAVAWADALDGLTVDECSTAIRAHYRQTTEWLMPAHIRAHVLMVRRDIAERRHSEQLHVDYQATKQAAIGTTRP